MRITERSDGIESLLVGHYKQYVWLGWWHFLKGSAHAREESPLGILV